MGEASGDRLERPAPTRAGRTSRWGAGFRRAGVGVVCVALLGGIAPRRAFAQQPAPIDAASADQAQTLFDEGRDLFDQGRFREACEKFEQSLALEPSPGTLLNLGNCYEPQGDLVRALATFERAFADAQKSSDAQRRELWSNAARERISSLTRRVPQISVRGVQAGTGIWLDKKPYDPSGGLVRINPGHHVIEATAVGKRPFKQEFDIAPEQRLAINVPPLEPEVGSAPPAVAPAPTEAPPPEPASSSGGSKFGVWPYVAGGAGVALLGTSLITGLSAKSKADQLDKDCPNRDRCDPRFEDDRDSAKTLALVTDVLWITGALAVGAGVTLFILDDGATESGTAVQTGCFDAGCGVIASGRF